MRLLGLQPLLASHQRRVQRQSTLAVQLPFPRLKRKALFLSQALFSLEGKSACVIRGNGYHPHTMPVKVFPPTQLTYETEGGFAGVRLMGGGERWRTRIRDSLPLLQCWGSSNILPWWQSAAGRRAPFGLVFVLPGSSGMLLLTGSL